MIEIEKNNPDIIKLIVTTLKVKHSVNSRFFSSLKAVSKPFTTSTSACHSHADNQPQQELQLQTKEREDQQHVAKYQSPDKDKTDLSVVSENEPLDSNTEAEKNFVERIKSIKQEREDLTCRLPEMEQPGSDQENLNSEASLSSESLLDEQQFSSVHSLEPEDLDQFTLSLAVAVHKEQRTIKTRELHVFNLSPAVAVQDQQANYKKYVSDVNTLSQQIKELQQSFTQQMEKELQRMYRKNDIHYRQKFEELQRIIRKNESKNIILRPQVEKEQQRIIQKNESKNIILGNCRK